MNLRRTIYIGLAVAGVTAAVLFALISWDGAGPAPSIRQPAHPGEIRMLVISDIHNNLAAVKKIDELARRYQVDLILDAGDLTDFGSRSEMEVVDAVGKLPAPHVFVAGNHDSTFTLESLRRFKNTYLPDERIVEVAGLRILGQNDPASRSPAPHSVDTTEAQRQEARRALSNPLTKLSRRPDVLIVHQPDIGEKFAGGAGIIVTGHGHRAYVRKVSGSVIVNPGSTGAAGIRYFVGSRSDKMTAAVIFATSAPNVRVKKVEMISIDTRTGKETVQTVGKN